MIPKAGRWGIQPALHLIEPSSRYRYADPPGCKGRVAEVSRLLGIEAGTLRSYLLGRAIAPAEIRLRLAEEVLRIPVWAAWSPEYLASVYVGPRGGGAHGAGGTMDPLPGFLTHQAGLGPGSASSPVEAEAQ